MTMSKASYVKCSQQDHKISCRKLDVEWPSRQ